MDVHMELCEVRDITNPKHDLLRTINGAHIEVHVNKKKEKT